MAKVELISLIKLFAWNLQRSFRGCFLVVVNCWIYIVSRWWHTCGLFHNVLVSSQWRHSDCNGVSNQRLLYGLLNRLFRRRSKKTSKLRVTGLCEGNSPGTGEFPAQRASGKDNVSIWLHYYVNLPRKSTTELLCVLEKDENKSYCSLWCHDKLW